MLATRVAQLGLGCKVFACNTFEGVVKAGDNDSDYSGGEHNDVTYEKVLELFSNMRLDNRSVLKGIFPEDTGSKLQDHRFRLVHVDVDVYKSAMGVVEFAWPRLSVGGVVVFDDYGFSSTSGIRLAVDELGESLSNCTMIHNLNGHGILVKNA